MLNQDDNACLCNLMIFIFWIPDIILIFNFNSHN